MRFSQEFQDDWLLKDYCLVSLPKTEADTVWDQCDDLPMKRPELDANQVVVMIIGKRGDFFSYTSTYEIPDTSVLTKRDRRSLRGDVWKDAKKRHKLKGSAHHVTETKTFIRAWNGDSKFLFTKIYPTGSTATSTREFRLD